VYDSSQFSAISGPALITAISFRPNGGNTSGFSSTLPSIQINLSNTSAVPDGLSTTFATNLGANDTQVYSGALSLSSLNTGGPPKNFDIVITLQTPFLYIPANGNILMDVRNFGAGTTALFDAAFTNGDSISRVLTNGSGVGSATADISDTVGLVTQFTFIAVPEPTTWAFMGLGVIGSTFFMYLRKRKDKLLVNGEVGIVLFD